MKMNSSEIVVVALLAVIGAIVLTGYFVAGGGDATPEMPPDETPAQAHRPDERKKPSRETVVRTPKMELSTENISFGDIDPYDVQKADVTIKNIGAAPLVIEDIKPSCGCTTVGIDQTTIAVNEETTIHIELDPQKFGGPSPRIKIMIRTNDPKRKLAQLNVTAEISPEFTIGPRTLDFGNVGAGSQPELMVLVEQKLDEAVVLEKIEAGHPGLEVEFVELAPEQGTGYRRYEVTVRVKKDCQLGPLTSEIGIYTGIKRAPVEPVNILGEVIGVEPVPSTIQFGMMPPGSGEIASILVSGPYEFEITSAKVDIQGFEIKTETGRIAADHVAHIIMTEDARSGAKHGAIKIVAEGNDRRRVMMIPFHGLVHDAGGGDQS